MSGSRGVPQLSSLPPTLPTIRPNVTGHECYACAHNRTVGASSVRCSNGAYRGPLPGGTPRVASAGRFRYTHLYGLHFRARCAAWGLLSSSFAPSNDDANSLTVRTALLTHHATGGALLQIYGLLGLIDLDLARAES